MKTVRIFIIAITTICIAMKEVYKIEGFLANDQENNNSESNNNNNNNTLFDSMLEGFEYLSFFSCKSVRMKKRYDYKWFIDQQTTLKDVQPFFFLHIHKDGGMTVVKELEVLWKDKYWCQSEASFITIFNDKSIFPYKKPRVITFIRKPLDRVLSSYRMNYDLAIAKGQSREDMMMDMKLIGDIDHCFDNQTCTNRYVDYQYRIIGGTFDRRKFWFVGITEMMYTSLCLLKYKMGCITAPFVIVVTGLLPRFHTLIITPVMSLLPLLYPKRRRELSFHIVDMIFRSMMHPFNTLWRNYTQRRSDRT